MNTIPPSLKEEIFNKHSFKALGAISPSKHFCLDAMEEYAKLYAAQQLQPPGTSDAEHCNVCGGQKVYIRGRYPKQDKRSICPTCAYERLEQINEMSSPNYGVAMTETKQSGDREK